MFPTIGPLYMPFSSDVMLMSCWCHADVMLMSCQGHDGVTLGTNMSCRGHDGVTLGTCGECCLFVCVLFVCLFVCLFFCCLCVCEMSHGWLCIYIYIYIYKFVYMYSPFPMRSPWGHPVSAPSLGSGPILAQGTTFDVNVPLGLPFGGVTWR